jgi:hypothetical protein
VDKRNKRTFKEIKERYGLEKINKQFKENKTKKSERKENEIKK